MSRIKDWWHNTNYDRDYMEAFYEARPEWSDLPPEAVARSFAFQAFSAGEAFREVGRAIKRLVEP